MYIRIKSGDTNLNLHLPTGLVLNRMTAGLVSNLLKQNDVVLSKKQIVGFAQELKACKKRFGSWNLVQIQSAEGDQVEIRL